MIPLLEQARELRDTCHSLDAEAIERPGKRPSFHVLFRDVHAFSRGVGNAGRVVALVEGLAGRAGLTCQSVNDGGGAGGKSGRAELLQEEAVWQGAAGAFVSRFRAQYGESYTDVVTGVCDAVEVVRVGVRMLAAAASSSSAGSAQQPEDGGALHGIPRLAKLQGFLLGFPYTCSGVSMGEDGCEDDHLRKTLEFALDPEVRVGKSGTGRGKAEDVSPVCHMAVLQVRSFSANHQHKPRFANMTRCPPGVRSPGEYVWAEVTLFKANFHLGIVARACGFYVRSVAKCVRCCKYRYGEGKQVERPAKSGPFCPIEL